jgi:hypothetical protein
MSITGFIIDGSAGASTDTEFAAYQSFSPDGIGRQYGSATSVQEGMPTCLVQGSGSTVAAAGAAIAGLVTGTSAPTFLWVRSVLQNPSWYAQLSFYLAQNYPGISFNVVDAYTFFGLLGINLGLTPENKSANPFPEQSIGLETVKGQKVSGAGETENEIRLVPVPGQTSGR